jgi:hypothetical protein
MDGVMVLHEILHDTRIKDGLVLKFEKAYDKLNWEFLFECLRQRGFCTKWCEWIKLVMVSQLLQIWQGSQTRRTFVSLSVQHCCRLLS